MPPFCLNFQMSFYNFSIIEYIGFLGFSRKFGVKMP